LSKKLIRDLELLLLLMLLLLLLMMFLLTGQAENFFIFKNFVRLYGYAIFNNINISNNINNTSSRNESSLLQ